MNINELMKQMQKVQAGAQKAQEELGASTVEGTAGGGAVKIVLTGNYEVKSVALAPEALDGGDREMIEDLFKAALEDALDKVKKLVGEVMSKAMGGFKVPGMPGLF